MNCWSLIASDYKKYKKYGGNFITIVFFTQGFWAIFQFRIANSVFKLKIPILKQLLQILTLIWQKNIEIITGISIPASATIGHSFYIGHFGGIIFNAKTKIGNNCNISQGVTIGVSGLDENRGVPIIGDNVYIGDDSVMVGVPAVKVSNLGSRAYI
jgi:serine O-acetyltransferase